MSNPVDIKAHPASYRDPAGFIFVSNGVIYRQVNQSYAKQYEQLMKSGLYERLTAGGHLISHTQVADPPARSADHYVTLLPRQLTRLSYSTEWCPEQLKDAALLTLNIQLLAMDQGMTLKDATPYNIQFDHGLPVFIDTLSFDHYDPSKPWIAYRQFCECFLFPLYLHRYTRIGSHKFAAAWPEGISVAETAALLPFRSRFNIGVRLHVFLQNMVNAQKQPASPPTTHRFSRVKLTRLLQHLQTLVSRILPGSTAPSTWSNYYSETILNQSYLEAKQVLFQHYLEGLSFTDAIDLGCNDGRFSKILAATGKPVIAADADWQCIQHLYHAQPANILPLCIDLSNPTPATGFQNTERASFAHRAQSDLVAALALIHHLALQHNIPLPLLADFFGGLTKKYLLIEFIPLSDEKAQQLIARKETPPANYDWRSFEAAFSAAFHIQRKEPIPGTQRLLYLLTKR